MYFLNIMEEIIYVLEYPDQLVCWLTYHNDRLDGNLPDDRVFPKIVKNHFPMMVADFFNKRITDDKFMAFQTECFKSCACLCYDQVKHVYDLMLHFESANNM